MKRIFLVLSLVAFGLSSYAQDAAMKTERTGMFSVTNDTLLITKADKIFRGSLVVVGDSCKVTGTSMTIGGIASNGVMLTTDKGFNWGFGYAPSDTIRIMCYGEVWISLLKDEN